MIELDPNRDVLVVTRYEQGEPTHERMSLRDAIQQYEDCMSGMTGMTSVTIFYPTETT